MRYYERLSSEILKVSVVMFLKKLETNITYYISSAINHTLQSI